MAMAQGVLELKDRRWQQTLTGLSRDPDLRYLALSVNNYNSFHTFTALAQKLTSIRIQTADERTSQLPN